MKTQYDENGRKWSRRDGDNSGGPSLGGFPAKMRHRVALMVLVCATLLASHPALAQFAQQGPKLVGTGAAGNAWQGSSVSLSADGNTAIVGGYNDNNNAGAAWVWTRSGGVWTQQGNKLVGSDAWSQGFSVSLSADGNTAIVGFGHMPDISAGFAWVWTRSGVAWTQQGTKLVGSDARGITFGISVSLSADGNTAIAGVPDAPGFAGAAWVWTRNGGVWTQQGIKLVGSGAVGNAQQGSSVSLSGDGNTAIVGGPGDKSNLGAAWVWTRSGGVWTQQGAKLVGSGDDVGIVQQGSSVSLSADGNTAIVVGYGDNGMWVWTRSGGVWTQQGPKLRPSGAGAAPFPNSLSLSADGNTAIVGGFDNGGGGQAAWVWTRSGGVWTQHGSKLVGSGAVGGGSITTVSLSADGNTAIVGGGNDNNGAGAAWVFTASTPSEVQILTHPIGQTVPGGTRVQLSVAAVGAGPLHYQWRFTPVGQPAQDIPGANSATLVLAAATAAEAGQYSVRAWNATSSAQSRPAYLSVLTTGANGNEVAQIAGPTTIVKLPGKTSLVVVTHGWDPKWKNLLPNTPPVLPDWVTELANAIQSRVPSEWQVVALDWALDAWKWFPDSALIAGDAKGTLLGKALVTQAWEHVHLIGNSAGAALIDAAAREIKRTPSDTVVHCTFLDPYLSSLLVGNVVYGAKADWADCYYTAREGGWLPTGEFTGRPLLHAHNEEVSWLDPDSGRYSYHTGIPYLGTYTLITEAMSSHDWPHKFYLDTVTNTEPRACAAGVGFPLSKEGGHWSDRLLYPTNNQPFPLCGESPLILQKPLPLVSNPFYPVEAMLKATSGSVGIFAQGFNLNRLGTSPMPPGRQGKDDSDPVWLAVAVEVTNAVNYVEFAAGFSGTGGGQGLMTVYWNTNQIGMVDERVAVPGLQPYRFPLPGTLTEGLYTLSFQLDTFTNLDSSITVTNVAAGFVGITEPLRLAVLPPGTNSFRLLQLTGAAGYSYMVEASTNLVNWTPTVLVVNSNGTTQFSDPQATNTSQRFYRALLR
jgi:hypothetical protein